MHLFSNDAWVCADVVNVTSADNSSTEPEMEDEDPYTADDGELDEVMNFFAWHDDGDNIYEGPDVDEFPFFDQPINGASFLTEDFSLALADATTPHGPLPAGDVAYLGLAWCAGDMNVNGTVITCDGAPVDNKSQTDSITADIMFRAVQSRNNEDFTCGRDQEPEGPIVALGSVNFEDYAGARYRSFGNTGANEVYVGQNDLGVGVNRSEIGFTWTAPGSHKVEVAYDSTLNQVTASVDENDVTHADGLSCNPNRLQFSVVARDTGTTVALNNVDLDGNVLGNYSVSDGDASEWVTWNVSNYDFSNDFSFSADLDLIGTFGTSQENSKVQIDFGCTV